MKLMLWEGSKIPRWNFFQGQGSWCGRFYNLRAPLRILSQVVCYFHKRTHLVFQFVYPFHSCPEAEFIFETSLDTLIYRASESMKIWAEWECSVEGGGTFPWEGGCSEEGGGHISLFCFCAVSLGSPLRRAHVSSLFSLQMLVVHPTRFFS